MNEAVPIDVIDGGDRTPDEKAEIRRLGQGIANLLATASSPEILVDIVVGMLVSSALNTGLDEEFVGVVVSESMKVMPVFQAHRAARDAKPVQH